MLKDGAFALYVPHLVHDESRDDKATSCLRQSHNSYVCRINNEHYPYLSHPQASVFAQLNHLPIHFTDISSTSTLTSLIAESI